MKKINKFIASTLLILTIGGRGQVFAQETKSTAQTLGYVTIEYLDKEGNHIATSKTDQIDISHKAYALMEADTLINAYSFNPTINSSGYSDKSGAFHPIRDIDQFSLIYVNSTNTSTNPVDVKLYYEKITSDTDLINHLILKYSLNGDIADTNTGFVKYPWLVSSITNKNAELQNYWYNYDNIISANEFDYYNQGDDKNSSKWVSLTDTMSVLKTSTGQSITDILGVKKSLVDYTKYMILSYDTSTAQYEAKMYYISYAPDTDGNLQMKTNELNFKSNYDDVMKLPDKSQNHSKGYVKVEYIDKATGRKIAPFIISTKALSDSTSDSVLGFGEYILYFKDAKIGGYTLINATSIEGESEGKVGFNEGQVGFGLDQLSLNISTENTKNNPITLKLYYNKIK